MNIDARSGASTRAAGWVECLSTMPHRSLGRTCLRVWICATILWIVVGGGLGWIINNQVSAGRDLAHEIAQLDCTTDTERCPDIETTSAGWVDVADLIWTFGSGYVLAAALLPPFVLLLGGFGVLFCRRDRRRSRAQSA